MCKLCIHCRFTQIDYYYKLCLSQITDDYAKLAMLANYASIDKIEINLAGPNTEAATRNEVEVSFIYYIKIFQASD